MALHVTRLCDTAVLPTPNNDGFDLYSAFEYKLYPGERCVVSTGCSIDIPKGYTGLLTPIAGLAVKHDLNICSSVMDPREVRIVMFNNDLDATYHIKPGYRVGTLVIVKTLQGEVHDVTGHEMVAEKYYKATGV
jgi:dUTPase